MLSRQTFLLSFHIADLAEPFAVIIYRQPHNSFLIDNIGHVSIHKVVQTLAFGIRSPEIFVSPLDDAGLPIVIDDVEVSGGGEWAGLHVEDLLVLIVPVGEQKRDQKEGIQQDVECESPANEADRQDRMDYALALGIIWLVCELEGTGLESAIFRAILRLLHTVITNLQDKSRI